MTLAAASSAARECVLGVLVAILLMLDSTGQASAVSFEDGVSAWQRGDYPTAIQIFRPFAEEGNGGAQYWLGLAYSLGKGVPTDRGEGDRWLRRGAEHGYAPAQFLVGNRYRYGIKDEVLPNTAEALKWYILAAEQGYAPAEYVAGMIYIDDPQYVSGPSVPQNFSEALKWFSKAAEGGHPAAEFMLGTMYLKGQGVPKDYAKALENIRPAADSGMADAQYQLGIMYQDGLGLSRDLVVAEKWFNLAVSREGRPEIRRTMAERRDQLETKLTPAEVAEAQKQASSWRPVVPSTASVR